MEVFEALLLGDDDIFISFTGGSPSEGESVCTRTPSDDVSPELFPDESRWSDDREVCLDLGPILKYIVRAGGEEVRAHGSLIHDGGLFDNQLA